MKICALLYLAAVSATPAMSSPSASVHRNVHRRLAQDATVDIVVEMRGEASHRRLLANAESLEFGSRKQKIEYLVTTLEAAATESQREIDSLLAHEASLSTPLFASQYQSWSRNARYFNGATFALVEKLASLPSVASIREAEVGSVETVAADAAPATILHAKGSIEWGVKRVQAPEAWAAGVTGKGVVVGGLDTGVRYTHALLRDSMRSDYNWFDPVNRTMVPTDTHGHGTHTMGTTVGADGLGVSPGSQWIACQGCPAGKCPEAVVMACGEWFVCPTDPQGNNRDCSKAPHVINNSWSGNAGSKVYAPMVAAWYAAGIIPFFAIGNKGPYCNTAKSPGNFANVIGVGSTTINNTLSWFSCKGPNGFDTSIIKPDLSAPGHEVVSASHLADDEYVVMSGTSMATPHVTGIAALLLSQDKTLTYEKLRGLLTSTTLRDVLAANLLPTPDGWYTGVCGNTTDADWPNNQYGYGLVNALRASEAVKANK